MCMCIVVLFNPMLRLEWKHSIEEDFLFNDFYCRYIHIVDTVMMDDSPPWTVLSAAGAKVEWVTKFFKTKRLKQNRVG